MRRRLAWPVLLLLSIAPAFALADEPPPPEPAQKSLFSFKTDDRDPLFGDRFTLKAGYKVWVAKWQAQVQTGAATNQVNADHPSAMNGPTITGILRLRESDWFNALVVNFTWLSDGFDFAETSANSTHFFANRRDYSITASLAIWEGFGIFAGYYNSRQEITDRPNNPAFTTSRHSRLMDGPIVGVFGTVPASERVSLYGNLAYALLKFSGNRSNPNFIQDSDAVQGFMNEVGITIMGPRIWRVGTELQLGFRAQIVQKNFGANATGSGLPSTTNQAPLLDVTYGPIFSVNAVF